MNKKQIIADIEETAEMAFLFSQRLDYIIKNNLYKKLQKTDKICADFILELNDNLKTYVHEINYLIKEL